MKATLYILPVLFLLIAAGVEATATNILWNDGSTTKTIEYGELPEFQVGVSSYNYPIDITIDMFNSKGQRVHVFYDGTVNGIAYFASFGIESSFVQAGENYSIYVYGKDAWNDESTSYLNLYVQPPSVINHPPVISPIAPQSVVEGQLVQFTVVASDPDGDPVTLNAIHVPAGATFDPVTGKFSWVPSYSQGDEDPTTYRIIFTASDGKLSASAVAEIKVFDYQEPNQKPTAAFTWTPQHPQVNQQVLLDASASSDPDQDALTFAWDLDNDGSFDDATGVQASLSFSKPGDYPIGLRVSDGTLSDTVYHTIPVVGNLVIKEFTCFDTVIKGQNQSCSVFLTDGEQPVGDAAVDIYLDPDQEELFGTCTTNLLSGGCAIKHTMQEAGTFTVYAYAHKEGYEDPAPAMTSFTVLDHRYDIKDFEVFYDPGFTIPQYTFFRGDDIYVRFKIYDRLTHCYVKHDVVTAAALVSNMGGGRIDLDALQPLPDGYWYKYALQPIPLTHEFIGDSNVFVFAFDFDDGYGGQAEKTITILNNLPIITPMAPIILVEGESETIDLLDKGFDREDPANKLIWLVVDGPEGNAAADLDQTLLTITGIHAGNDAITLELRDLDYVLFPHDRYPTETIPITVLPANHAPVLDHIGDKSVTEGNLLSFIVKGEDPDGDTLTFGASPLPAGATFNPATGQFSWVPSYTQGDENPTSYEVTFSVTDGQYTDTETITIDVYDYIPENQAPVAHILEPEDGAVFDEDMLIQFVGEGIDPEDGVLQGDALAWYINGQLAAQGTGFSTFLEPGTYTIKLVATDTQGLTGQDTIHITVEKIIPVNHPPIVHILQPADQAVFQENTSISFLGEAIDPEDGVLSGTALQWYADSVGIGAGTSIAEVLPVGEHTISLIATDDEGLTSSDTISITVEAVPLPELKAVLDGPYRWYATKPLQMDASGSIGLIVLYQFDFGDGTTLDSTTPVVQHTYARPGIYTIQLIVKDAEGRADATTTTGTIMELPVHVEEPVLPEQSLYIGNIYLYGDSVTQNNVFRLYDAGTVVVELTNTGDETLKDLRVTLLIPDLGIKVNSGAFDLKPGASTAKQLRVFMDYGWPDEEYYAKILVNNAELSRVKYRYFTLIE